MQLLREYRLMHSRSIAFSTQLCRPGFLGLPLQFGELVGKPHALAVGAVERGLQFAVSALRFWVAVVARPSTLMVAPHRSASALARDLDLATQMLELGCAFVEQPRLLDDAVFQILAADFVFGGLRHQLLYKLGDATMEISNLPHSSISFWVAALSSMLSASRRSSIAF